MQAIGTTTRVLGPNNHSATIISEIFPGPLEQLAGTVDAAVMNRTRLF
jgi:hypothetical protein